MFQLQSSTLQTQLGRGLFPTVQLPARALYTVTADYRTALNKGGAVDRLSPDHTYAILRGVGNNNEISRKGK